MEEKKKFVLSFSNTQGKEAEKEFRKIEEFSKEISALTQNGNLKYVKDLYASNLLNSTNLEERNKDKEEKKDFELRKLSEIRKEIEKMTEEEIKALKEYTLLSSKNAIYSICRNYLPCFVEQTEEDKANGKDGKSFYAKEKVIAYRIAELTDEQKEKYEKNTLYVKQLIETEEDKAYYFVNKNYEIKQGTQVIRRKRYEEKKEQNIYLFKNGKISVMEKYDKMTFADLYEICSYHLQLEAEKAKKAKEAEAERLARLSNFADITEAKKAEYLEISAIIEKHLNLGANKIDLQALTKKVNEAEEIAKKFDLQEIETEAMKQAKEIIASAKEEAKKKKEERKAKKAKEAKEAEAKKDAKETKAKESAK